jgi:hypothetical protein
MGSCASEKPVERLLPDTPQSRLQLSELPVEIHEAILDHLFGFVLLHHHQWPMARKQQEAE